MHFAPLPPIFDMCNPFSNLSLPNEGPDVLWQVPFLEPRCAGDALARHLQRDFRAVGVLREVQKMEENPFLRGEAQPSSLPVTKPIGLSIEEAFGPKTGGPKAILRKEHLPLASPPVLDASEMSESTCGGAGRSGVA